MKEIKILDQYLTEKNLRKTPERHIILKYIYTIDSHFDIDYLYNHINKKEQISKATIYNNLTIFSSAKLINQLHFNGKKVLYEKSLNKTQHDHLICSNCGKIVEFCDPRIQSIINGIEKITNFQVHGHSLNVYGKCKSKNCQ